VLRSPKLNNLLNNIVTFSYVFKIGSCSWLAKTDLGNEVQTNLINSLQPKIIQISIFEG